MTRIMKNHNVLKTAWLLAAWQLFPGTVAAEAAKGPLVLAATIFPAVDIARHIAGPDNRVIQILPAAASPHTFDLTPGKVRELQSARIIFKIGAVDDWIDGVADSLPQAVIISLQKNISLRPAQEEGHSHGTGKTSHHEDFDPHYWLSAENGVIMAQTISETLAKADPDRADEYRRNYRAYALELANLHQELMHAFAGLANRRMIVFHDAWRYFAAAYGLEIAAVFQASPGREPTPRDIQKLYSQVKRFGIKAIFSEPQLPTASLEPMVQDLGLQLVVLDPLGGSSPADSYAGMLRRNARAIRRALER